MLCVGGSSSLVATRLSVIQHQRGSGRAIRLKKTVRVVNMKCVLWAALAAAALCACAGGVRAQSAARSPRPACPPADSTLRCREYHYQNRIYEFFVNGYSVTYEFTEDGIFTMACALRLALDEPALARFQPALRVRKVLLHNCWPRATTYAAALRGLNVTALDEPGRGADSTYLIELNLLNANEFDPNMLAAMPNLRNLSISITKFTVADLERLPAGLERLQLINTGTGRVPADALARLPHLADLFVASYDPVLVEVGVAQLSSLIIHSPATTMASLSLPDTLEGLDLTGWVARRPEPWRTCAGLVTLALTGAVEKLPDGWLARCARLRVLRLENTRTLALAAGALRGATALQEVRCIRCGLEVLPAGLLDDARALRVLNLMDNRLHTLPGELFRRTKSLSELYLSGNNLTGSVLGVLETLSTLNVLRLDDNPSLDACPRAADAELGAVQGSSPLSRLPELSELGLRATGARRVCAGWRRLPRLARLDLFNTPIETLDYTDLQFNSTADMIVGLPSSGFSLRRADYESVAAAPAAPTLTLELLGPLRCDCELYWTAAALRLPNTRLRISVIHDQLRCEDGRELRDVPLAELACAAPGPCPAGCACTAREDAARPGPVLRVDCAGAGLRRVPRVDVRAALRYTGAAPAALELRLADNSISRLTPEDLPPELTALDLRNNALGVLDAASAAALVSRADRVLVAGNPLECGCRAAAALAVVRAHPAVFRDRDAASCAGGAPLARAAPPPCDDGAGGESTTPHTSESSAPAWR